MTTTDDGRQATSSAVCRPSSIGMSPNILATLYDEFASEYERTRVPRFRPFVKKLLQLYDTRPGSYVLDAGCGTGLAATMVAPRVGHSGRVLGVDASERMLEIARQKAQGFGFDQCEFVLGDMEHLDVPSDAFDVVICSFALWGEPRELFNEFLRVLKPHGALLIQNWETDRGGIARMYGQTLQSFALAISDERASQARAAFSKHRADWAEVQTPQDYERVLRGIGFSQAAAQWFASSTHFKNLDELIEFHNIGIRSRAEIAAMNETTRAEFHAAAGDALQTFVTGHGVDAEWRAIQVMARK